MNTKKTNFYKMGVNYETEARLTSKILSDNSMKSKERRKIIKKYQEDLKREDF